MKHIFLSLLALFVMIGCTSNSVNDELMGIEALMDSDPEMALRELDSIKAPEIRNDNEQALFALLYSQALDKNYIDICNDSLIVQAVQFYEKSDDAYHQMLAHYYHGRIKYNAKEFPQSLVSMMKALKLAEQINHYYWHGRIAEQIANIYDVNFHTEDAIYYAHMAFDSLQKSQRQPFINYALFSLARVYNNNDRCLESIKYTKQVLDSAQLYHDKNLEGKAFDLLAISYFGANDYENAASIFSKIKEQKSLNDNMLSLYSLALLELGHTEDAEAVFAEMQEVVSNDNKALTYRIYQRKGDYESALTALAGLYDQLHDVFVSVKEQNFGQALSEVYAEDERIKELKLKKAHQSRKLSIGISAAIILILILVFSGLYRRSNKKIQNNILIAQNLQEILQIKDSGLQRANSAIQKLTNARYEIIDNLCKTIYEHKSTGLVKKKISAEVEMLIEQMSSDPQKILELEQILNENYSGLMTSFRKDLPNLKKADYLLFIYSSLGFSISAIALFLKEDKLEAIYNRKARLKNKIRKLTSEQADKYLPHLS